MRSYKDAKAMAKSLRDVLAVKKVALSHSECLEIVARQFGFPDWNTLSSKVGGDDNGPPMPKVVDARPKPMFVAPPPTVLGIERVPVMPLRDVVVYPGVVVPIFAARTKSLRAVDEAMRTDRHVLLVLQLQPEVNDPTADDVYRIGTLAKVIEESELQIKRESSAADLTPNTVPGATRRIVVKGVSRARVDMLDAADYVSAYITVLKDDQARDPEDLQLIRAAVMTRFEKYAERTGWPPNAWNAPPRADLLGMFGGFDLSRFSDTIAAHVPMRLAQKQEVLEILDLRKRLEYLDDITRKLE